MTAEVSGAGVSRVAAGVTTHVAPAQGSGHPDRGCGGASGAVRNTEKPTAELISRSRPSAARPLAPRTSHKPQSARSWRPHTIHWVSSPGTLHATLRGWRWRCRNIICTSISRICPHTLHQHSPSDSLRASHHIDLSSHAVSPQRSSSEYPHRCPPSAHPPHPHALLPRAACLNPGGGGESPLGRRLGRRPVDAALKLRPTLRPARAAAWPPRPGRGACGRGEARATSAAGARGCCRARGASPSA